MQTVLLVIHVILAAALIGVILIQRSEGGGLGMGRSDSGLMTARGQANLLTRTTAVLATLFFVTSITLAILTSHSSAPKSLFNPQSPSSAPAAAPSGPAAPGAAPGTPAPASPPAAAPTAPAPAPSPSAPAAPNK
jgi:preprotein translocase subunit SecG